MKPVSSAPADTPLASVDPALLSEIRSEVSTETQPLLQFILKNTKYIVGVICLLVAGLAGTAGYRMYCTSQQEKMQDAIATIEISKPAPERVKALEALAGETTERLRPVVWVAVAKNALDQHDFAKASEAYAMVAKSAVDQPLGLAASLGQAGTLMDAGKYAEGVAILQGVVNRIPSGVGDQVRAMLAEGAEHAGQYALAKQTYEALANATQGLTASYYRERAQAVAAMEPAAEKKAE